MNWTSQRAAQLQMEQDKHPKDTFTDTLRKVASSVTSQGIREGDPALLTALSMLFEEIQSQKRRTGTIKPGQFISTLKRENSTYSCAAIAVFLFCATPVPFSRFLAPLF